MITAQTLKGFRDFLPPEAIKRQTVISTFRRVFEQYGFDPLETPALEYAETLLGKYGNEADKLLYLFKDNGGRDVGMRYDQTVPLSRVVAQYPDLPTPFKRYQIQPVWRAENTQRGRFREFIQCDIDTVGIDTPLADAEIIAAALSATRALGITDAVMIINDRTVFDTLGLSKTEIIILDKLDKIGREEVIKQLVASGRTNAEELYNSLERIPPTERITQIIQALEDLGIDTTTSIRFDAFLARGLDYYTSTIYELKSPSYPAGSIAGGGRYDKLIGQFSGNYQPAVGLAFGFDRLVEYLSEFSLAISPTTSTQVLVTVFSPESLSASLQITKSLRTAGIATEVTLDANQRLDKQLKYANKKGIPFVLIQGPDEGAKNVVQLKDMIHKTQSEYTVPEVIERITNY